MISITDTSRLIQFLTSTYVTHLLSDGLPGHQLRLDGDEERDEGALSHAAPVVVAAVGAVAALHAVAQQHGRRVHLERAVDLQQEDRREEPLQALRSTEMKGRTLTLHWE